MYILAPSVHRCIYAVHRLHAAQEYWFNIFSVVTYIVKIAAANQSDAFVSLRIRGFLLAVPWWNGHVN